MSLYKTLKGGTLSAVVAIVLIHSAQAQPIFDLQQCLDYAQEHYPLFQQSQIDKQIVDKQVKERLSAWYPQVNFSADLQHTQKGQQGTITYGGQTAEIELTKQNISPLAFSVNQTLLDRDAIYSAKTASPTRYQAEMQTQYQWIDLQVNVTKAFYNVLLQQQQLQIYTTDVERLREALTDAQSRYKGGLVDKTDVQRSKIALNNGLALHQKSLQMVGVSYANLQQMMGYSDSVSFVIHDSIQSAIPYMYIDTTLTPNVENRVEYALLDTERKLLDVDLSYSHWGYMPNLSLYGRLPFTFSDNDFGSLYNDAYINPGVGVSLSIPLFEGLSRMHKTKVAKLNLERNKWSFEALKTSVSTEYANAIAIYKSNLANCAFLQENMEDAEEVYNIIFLQYKEGVKTFLDLTSAHSDLITAQTSYYNAVYQVVVSKVDVEKALGLIK